MYSSAPHPRARSDGSGCGLRVRTTPPTGRASCGLVPQVTCGSQARRVERHLPVPRRVRIGRERLPVRHRGVPTGRGRRQRPPLRYAKVISSGAIRPKRAPASIVMLHTVIRPSIDIFRIVSPSNSIAYPVPPEAPIFAITARIDGPSAPTRERSAPFTVTRIRRGMACHKVLRGENVFDLDVPTPKAIVPKAPSVPVWESPQTICDPRQERAPSRSDDVHDSCLGSVMSKGRSPAPRAFFPQLLDLLAALAVVDPIRPVGRGRNVVVRHGQHRAGPAHGTTRHRAALERLGARDLGGSTGDRCREDVPVLPRRHDVTVPDLFEQRRHGSPFARARGRETKEE